MLTRSISLAETLAALRCGELDLQQHVRALCERVDEVEGEVRALVPEPERRRRLLQEAGQLQAQYPDPAQRPLLYGALVGVKDIFHVDGFLTRAGTRVPAELFAGAEASCVRALRQAGALILGKTITTEFAYFEPGATRNPHHPAHTPGGSSSGSAAAVAAGYCALSLGSQTIGSVIRPAAFCGVAGFKPSRGRIPPQGLICFSKSVDQVGVFGQDVAGLQQAGSVLCRGWAQRSPGGRPALGVPMGPYLEQAEGTGLRAFEHQVEQLQAAGYEVKWVEALADIVGINQRHQRLIAAEMARVHASWFAEYGALYRPRTAALIQEGKEVRAEAEENARAGCLRLRVELEKLMGGNGIDVWICPSAPGPAPEGLDSTGDPVMNLPWTHAGLPVLGLPAGRAASDLPLGLQCVAGFMQDEVLLAWGEELAAVLSTA